MVAQLIGAVDRVCHELDAVALYIVSLAEARIAAAAQRIGRAEWACPHSLGSVRGFDQTVAWALKRAVRESACLESATGSETIGPGGLARAVTLLIPGPRSSAG